MKNDKEHWDKVYENSDEKDLGWYEADPELSLELIKGCNLEREARIFHAGAGISNLVERLIENGYRNQVVNDISGVALRKLKERIQEPGVIFIEDDLTHPDTLLEMDPVDLWHDRAVVHFFVDQNDQDRYFDLLRKKVRVGGYVIISVFSLNGAEKCNGLPVNRYSARQLGEKLGPGYSRLYDHSYIHTSQSGGKRPYIYTVFRKNR